ncbi:MAG: hypothetical protein ACR2NL_07920 [Acidimicrobiia bacterium]
MLDTLLLLALPASGKSELRRYLDTRNPKELSELHLRPCTQLDDYPYVHLMRRISAELTDLGQDPVFFSSSGEGWLEPRDWGTLIHLLNEDFEALTTPRQPGGAEGLLDRLDTARRAVGAPSPFSDMPAAVRTALCEAIADEVVEAPEAADVSRHTVVIEFARGGPDGAEHPLPPPHGYGYSLAQLSESILESAAILYVWVDPAESRRRNRERARPGREGDASILHHGVPETVMVDEYGTDDMSWLIEHGDKPGTVRVDAHDRTFHVPVARFDNRVDRTSFLRHDPTDWDDARLEALRVTLLGEFDQLARLRAGKAAG